MKAKKPLKLNLGCGSTKIDGYVNIDTEASCKPDKVWDFVQKKLPYDADSVDEVLLFHTIEHIRKPLHTKLLKDVWRVLKPEGLFIISFPEFLKCVENWRTNFKGQRSFWENTIYGRQLYPSDHHVCIMDSEEFQQVLITTGFEKLKVTPEPLETYNTVVSCVKGLRPFSYEEVISAEMDNYRFERK